MKYLYITLDFDISQQSTQPTNEDRQMVETGDLTVFMYDGTDFFEWFPDCQEQEWQKVDDK